jgi:signal transduction histidine kinase
MGAIPSTSLKFPDLPKVELDQLIEELVDRARGVQRSQGRLRALLRAIETVTGELALDAVLRHVVEAACDLAGARYGALGVTSYDQGLEQFIHVGMNAHAVAQIDHLPEGRGMLGAIVDDPRPIRLKHMTDDQRSSGFPNGHPPMDSFLGVPIRVNGEVFGSLYLTDNISGEFSAEDEELVGALALAAGTAIANARLLEESRLQQRWLTASVEINAQLLAVVGEDPLHMIARRAIQLADADLVTIGLLTGGGTELLMEVAFGVGADALLARRIRVADTLVRRAIEERTPMMLNAAQVTAHGLQASMGIDLGPLMALPLEGAQGLRGVLTLARVKGRRPFSGAELSMAAAFASHANIALELADARSSEQRLVLLEDRERIARDLHDHVIQELFAIGLSLDSAATLIGPDTAAAQRIQQRVADIDRTIRQIRTTIFELRGPFDTSPDGLRNRILEIAHDLTQALDFSPAVAFSGLVEMTLSASLAEDIAAVVREVLTNVARHAHASQATVEVAVSADEATVIVRDDGIGYVATERQSGLGNLRNRAALHGGSFTVQAGRTGGTTVTWKAPLS